MSYVENVKTNVKALLGINKNSNFIISKINETNLNLCDIEEIEKASWGFTGNQIADYAKKLGVTCTWLVKDHTQKIPLIQDIECF